MFDTVRQFFDDDEWYFMQMDSRPVLQMSHTGQSGRWPCYAQVDEGDFMFFFYSVCPVTVPESQRSAMAEYLTRANYGLKVGNFEMDFSDGEVRFKTSLDVENGELPLPLVSNLVYANVWTMDRYLPGIFEVIYGHKTPEQAILTVEGS
ncbi:MAG TPA: YbjN domain-containing protein [Anaerolineaceae bacterium]|nr:YbjN domain-containing protein [Anaerolineaceae bacterium]